MPASVDTPAREVLKIMAGHFRAASGSRILDIEPP